MEQLRREPPIWLTQHRRDSFLMWRSLFEPVIDAPLLRCRRQFPHGQWIIFLLLLLVENRADCFHTLFLKGSKLVDPSAAGHRWIEPDPEGFLLPFLQDLLDRRLLRLAQSQVLG